MWSSWAQAMQFSAKTTASMLGIVIVPPLGVVGPNKQNKKEDEFPSV